MRKTLLLLFSCISVCIPALCHAQRNDAAVSVGAVFSPNSVSATSAFTGVPCAPSTVGNCPTTTGCIDCLAPNAATSGVAFEAVLAHRVLNLERASLHLELPVMVAPNRIGNAIGNFSSVFLTPGLRMKFHLPIASPFLSAGGGLAHFSPKVGLNNPASTNGAFQVGGGLEIGTPLPRLDLRVEVRELRTARFASTQHNIFAGGGLVLKF